MRGENNIEIRIAAKEAGIYLWQIADALGIQDSALSRKLRRELPPEDRKKIMNAISLLAAQKGVAR